MTPVDEHREAIAQVCKDLGIERLDVFGSITGTGLTETSDIDVLVRFDRSRGRMFDRYFDLKENLEKVFDRPVDVVLEDSIQNPYFRESIESSRVNVYEA